MTLDIFGKGVYNETHDELWEDRTVLEKMNPIDYERVYHILEKSFPVDERRPYDAQKALLEEPRYSIFVYKENGEIVGFLATWSLDGVVFVEHFAVLPSARNQGLGTKALALLAERHELIVLEAEPPESELAVRRLGFYARAGLLPNDLPYLQPAYRKGEAPVPLLLLSRPAPLADPTAVAAEIHRVVYGVR